MVKQSLHPRKQESFTEKHIDIILFLLCVLVVFSVFVVALDINDPNIYTSIGGV
ncbi:MAG: hypothetical protein ISP01_05510 [Methanobrevibacter arboriphilus]|uniref:Uncharacterized protein n=1 Tax=Methanobrevibacter arboriphilus TaxID=39441 RepID=A0A843AI66_METAZ|nr:hypothetical protein [Methanobrevibacter arboriphilus]MBF4468846.1 hypothetical protein [Methanobrevibacter arboriphilus]